MSKNPHFIQQRTQPLMGKIRETRILLHLGQEYLKQFIQQFAGLVIFKKQRFIQVAIRARKNDKPGTDVDYRGTAGSYFRALV